MPIESDGSLAPRSFRATTRTSYCLSFSSGLMMNVRMDPSTVGAVSPVTGSNGSPSSVTFHCTTYPEISNPPSLGLFQLTVRVWLPGRTLVMMGTPGGMPGVPATDTEGVPGPLLLTAVTRTSYSWPLFRLGMV